MERGDQWQSQIDMSNVKPVERSGRHQDFKFAFLSLLSASRRSLRPGCHVSTHHLHPFSRQIERKRSQAARFTNPGWSGAAGPAHKSVINLIPTVRCCNGPSPT